MTDYTPRSGPDLNQYLTTPNLVMSHFSNGASNYVYSNSQIPYTAINTSYPAYSTSYLPSHHHQNTAELPADASQMPLQYHPTSSNYAPAISLPRMFAQNQHLSSQHSAPQLYSYSTRPPMRHDSYPMSETESQESINEATMLSEPVFPTLEGYPDVKEFDQLMKSYVEDLSPKKQDKALIHAQRAANIKKVLMDKKTTAVESAQFRFWVKKMFTLLPNDPTVPARKRKICHEGKPVAIREKLFKILTNAHKQCQHGGRDKTSAQVRRIYSWVPKELISRFVKLCPTCQVRRGSARTSPPESEKGSPSDYMDPLSPTEILSVPGSRRSSIAARQGSVNGLSPTQSSAYSTTFQSQNRWMSSAPQRQSLLSVHAESANCLPPSSTNNFSENAIPSTVYASTGLQSMDGHHSGINTPYMTSHGTLHHHHHHHQY